MRKICGSSRLRIVHLLGGTIARQGKIKKPIEIGDLKTGILLREVGSSRRSKKGPEGWRFQI